MATPYTTLYNVMLAKLTNYDYLQYTEEEVYDMIGAYLDPACIKFRVCAQDLFDRSEQFREFNVTLTPLEIDILTNLMVIEYLTANYVNTPSLLKSQMPSKDFSSFSPANHLREIMSVRDTLTKEVSQKMTIYSYTKDGIFTVPAAE